MKTFTGYVLAAAAAVAAASPASAAELIVNVAGATSIGELGEAGNTVRTFNIGANARLTSVAYNVSITAFTPSYLSEASLAFTNGAFTDGVLFTPGIADTRAGTATYTGTLDLVAEALDFFVDADGVLRLEFYEDFDDSGINPDGIWNSGTLTFTYEPGAVTPGAVPEPATWAMLIGGFGMMGGTLRRRRTAVRFAA